MNLKEQLDLDIKSAMISKNNVKRDILRFVKSEVQRSEAGKVIFDDTDIQKMMRTQIENLKTITNSTTSAEEISILESYLPTMMDEEHIRAFAQQCIRSGASNLGMIMKYFNENHKGKVDNKIVSQISKELLGC